MANSLIALTDDDDDDDNDFFYSVREGLFYGQSKMMMMRVMMIDPTFQPGKYFDFDKNDSKPLNYLVILDFFFFTTFT